VNVSQAAELLTLAAAFDQRTISREDASAWALALGGLDFGKCREAVVTHYAHETNRIMPGHIRRLAASRTGPSTVVTEDGRIECGSCYLVHYRHEACEVLVPRPELMVEALKSIKAPS
jgi:hypothetical protein